MKKIASILLSVVIGSFPIQEAHVTARGDKEQQRSTLRRTEQLPLCTKPTTKCPYDKSYKRSCKSKANKPPYLPKVDEDKLLKDLVSLLHGKRIALIGDSLTRQWFEMLSCRLGLALHFFDTHKPLPIRLQQAKEYGTEIVDLHVPPESFTEKGKHARGYAVSKVDSNNYRNNNCRTPDIVLEYYHHDSVDFNINSVLDFAAEYADLVVINLGFHNQINGCVVPKLYDCPDYQKQIEDIFQRCGKINKGQHGRCFFRETTPQHFVLKKGSDFHGAGSYDPAYLDTTKCGPITNIEGSGSHAVNQIANMLSKEYDVPIVHIESELIDAWRWHLKKSDLWDCSHFCQDNEVWDLFHRGLVTAEEMHLLNTAEDIY